jgi:hypothetical protein
LSLSAKVGNVKASQAVDQAGLFAQRSVSKARKRADRGLHPGGQVLNNKVSGARVAHSEANGVYDKIAVQMANNMTVFSDVVGTRVPGTVLPSGRPKK